MNLPIPALSRLLLAAAAWAGAIAGDPAAIEAQQVAQPSRPAASARESASPLEFRRVFVPAERTGEWPTDGTQYLPLERKEFERLVADAEERRQLEKSGAAQIVDAAFEATLGSDDLLQGTATLDVRQIDDGLVLVPLDPWNAVVLRGDWLEGPEEDERRKATLGLWDRGDGAEQYGLLVDQNGRAELQWQQAPERADDVLEFGLRLPNAVTRRLTLDLPAKAVPTLTGGRLLEQPPASNGERRRWTFQLGVEGEQRLRIRRPAAAEKIAAVAPQPLATMSEAYRLTADGVDYELELRLVHRGVAMSELRLDVPANLHLAEAVVGRESVSWRRDPDAATGMILSLPAAAEGAGGSQPFTTVRIRGAAAATFDAPWKLPAIVPRGVFWTEGTSTLWVDPALELRSIELDQCSLLNVVGVGAGAAGEVYRLQAWSPSATAELVVGERRAALRYRSGVAIEIADREVLAAAKVVLWSDGGRTYHVAAPVGESWSIESVAASPAEDLVEWHVDEGEARRLHLRLRRSPTADQPLRIDVTARRPWRAWTRMATVDDLDVLQLPGSSEGRWLSAVDRRGGELIPDAKLNEAVVLAADLPVAARELLGKLSQGVLIDVNRANRHSFLSAATTPDAYGGEAWMELSPLEAGYEHRAEIVCRPMTGAVSELRLLAARELPSNVVWEMSDGTPLTVVATPPQTTASDAAANGQSKPAARTAPRSGPFEYRLRLAAAHSTPFRVRATWRSSAPADAAANPLTLPDAQSWQAWATFRGHPDRVGVASGGAAAAVLPPPSSVDDLPAIASFRLSDDPTALPNSLPRYVERTRTSEGSGSATSSAVAWRLEATTEQLADGTQKHRFEYQLTALEPTEAHLVLLDRDATFTAVTLDGRTLVAAPAAHDARAIRFRIPGASGPQTLSVEVRRTGSPLGRGALIRPLLPRASFPVLHGSWTLLWPVAYEGTLEGVAGELGTQSDGWMSRLFGPLAGDGPHRWYDGMLLAHVDEAPSSAAVAAGRVAAPGGWGSLTQAFVDEPAPIALRLSSGEQANWHVAWLAAAVAGAWFWARSRRLSILVIGVVAAVCLVVPERFVPLPQAVFLGLAAGVVTRQVVRFLTKSRPVPASGATRSPSATGARHATSAVAVMATLLTCQAAVAQPAAATGATAPVAAAPGERGTTSPPKAPPKVLFPVDDAGQPAGADVYVPAEMAARLLPADAGPPAVLIEARHQIELQASEAADQFAVRAVNMRFRWESLRSPSRVELPLVAAEGVIAAESLLLDGRATAARWNAQGTALVVDLPAAGRHELTLTLTPAPQVVTRDGAEARLQLHLPRLSGTTVEVLHPAGLTGLKVANGAPRVDQSSASRTVFKLGAVPLLELAWPARPVGDAAGVAVDQLSVLEADPVAATLRLRLRIAGGGKPIDSLRLITSPQLKLLPLPEGSPLELVSVQEEASGPGAVELRLPGQPAYPLQVALQFQLQRNLSVGRIDYPWVEVPGMNVRSRHFAVTADPSLEVRDAVAAGLTPVAPAELEPLWGAAATDAALSYAVAVARPSWALDVAPRALRFTSRESLELHCGDNEVAFAYTAAIAEIDGQALVHRLSVPADLHIDVVTASLESTGEEVPIRWSRSQPGQVELFLGRPLREPHVIRAEGRVAEAIRAVPPAQGATPTVERHVAAPLIALDAMQAAPIDVLVFRSSDVLVDWLSPAPTAKPLGPLNPERDIVVGQFSVARNAPAPELEIIPNDATYDADALMTLHLEGVEPIAECQIAGRATRGVVDRLRLTVGKNWRGPFVCDPPARLVERPLPTDAGQKVLDVRLSRPVAAGGSFRLMIRGAVSLEEDQRIRFPDLQLADAERRRTYVILPETAGNLTAEWTLRGLVVEPLPEEMIELLEIAQPPLARRVTRQRFIAEQRVFPDAMRSPEYRLAECRASIAASGGAVALARLIVQAGGGESCRVTLPDGAELQYASVDGALQPRPAPGTRTWDAPPGSRFLPRVFLFSYVLPSFDVNAPRTFEPPQVAVDGRTLAPRTTLWRVSDSLRGDLFESQQKRLSDSQMAAVARQKQIEAFLDAYPLASQLAEWEFQSWRQPWFDRLDSFAGVALDDPVAWTRLRERIATSAPRRDFAAVDVVDQWDRDFGEADCFVGAGEGRLTLTPRTSPWPIGRWLAALALSSAIAVAWRRPAALQNVALPAKRWPYAALGLVGALWWLLLEPSVIGLILIAFAMAAYWKSRR